MTARTALSSVAVFAWVLFMGSLADFYTTEGRTGFALGVVAAVPAFLLADWVERR